MYTAVDQVLRNIRTSEQKRRKKEKKLAQLHNPRKKPQNHQKMYNMSKFAFDPDTCTSRGGFTAHAPMFGFCCSENFAIYLGVVFYIVFGRAAMRSLDWTRRLL